MGHKPAFVNSSLSWGRARRGWWVFCLQLEQAPRGLISPKPPQIQSWHVHNSLHCGEGSSSERQLLADSHALISSLDARVRPRARDVGCEMGLCLLWGIPWVTHPLGF